MTQTQSTTRTRKKINAEIVKFSDMKVGAEVEGKFLSRSERPWLDRSTGEEKIIPQFTFKKLNSDERFTVFGDAGLVNAMTAAGVMEGQEIAIVKKEQVELDGGKRVNNYDIFELQ